MARFSFLFFQTKSLVCEQSSSNDRFLVAANRGSTYVCIRYFYLALSKRLLTCRLGRSQGRHVRVKGCILLCHTIHLVGSQEPGQHCTYSGSFWSTLFYTVLTAAMSDLALWLLRNPETARFFGCLILQANGSLGLPRNKRTVVPLFTFLFKVVDSQRGIWILDGESCVWKVLGSTRAKVLWTGQLSQADPSMVKVQVKSHYQCVLIICLHRAGPRPHIPFPPDLIL